MKTKLDQILKKINLSKSIQMERMVWDKTIDTVTYEKLKQLGYEIQEDYIHGDYYISW